MARSAGLVALITILSGYGLAAQDEGVHHTEVRTELPTGKVLLSAIPWDALEDSPRWLATDPNPPLSARKAISLAGNTKTKVVKELQLFDEARCEWRLSKASLMPRNGNEAADLWFWEVRYEVTRVGDFGPTSIPFYVLMDGTAIEPTLDDQ